MYTKFYELKKVYTSVEGEEILLKVALEASSTENYFVVPGAIKEVARVFKQVVAEQNVEGVKWKGVHIRCFEEELQIAINGVVYFFKAAAFVKKMQELTGNIASAK